MEDLSDIRSLPLSSLALATRRLLSNLLDSTKVLTTEGPIKRHRDWRGLASLVNISSELEATIWHCNDKTGKVLDLWMQSRAGVVGELLEHLIALDRFDVYDDIIASIREHQERSGNQVALLNNNYNQYNNNQIEIAENLKPITYEDQPGRPHNYDAFVLYAEADVKFVMELKGILNGHGFDLCMKDNLLPGYASHFAPISTLIAERCSRVILVYSPDFLKTHDVSFFRDNAQAISIMTARNMMLPIMYRMCPLPSHLNMYCQLYYNKDDLNLFWSRLIKTMQITRMMNNYTPAPQDTQQRSNNSLSSAVNIHTMSESAPESYNRFFLPPNPVAIRSFTPSNVSVAPSNVSVTPSNTSVAPSVVPLAPSDVSLTTSSLSLSQSLASQMNTTDMLIKPAKKRGFINKFIPKMFKGKKNKSKIVNTMTPSRPEQLCA